MRLSSWQRPQALLRRRITVAVMLATYLLATTGVPVPARIIKPSDTPFPCQHHACGCVTAEQCRDQCCCFTASQRLAWARAQGVKPTAALLAEAAAEARPCDHGCQEDRSAPRACCAHRTAQTSPLASRRESSTTETRLVLRLSASKCRPISSMWCVVGAVLVPPAVSWHFQWNVVEWVSPLSAPFLLQDLSPPVPPPRI
jgi:hypothetical protein